MPIPHPQRKWLRHDLPHWVNGNGAIFYITICCEERDRNQLCVPEVAEEVFETVAHRVERGLWYPHIFLLMPDHLHALLSFPSLGKGMKATVREWKGWVKKCTGICWQRGFFDHRLRSDESQREKADYILQNPVREGLVERPEDWPYVWYPKW